MARSAAWRAASSGGGGVIRRHHQHQTKRRLSVKNEIVSGGAQRRGALRAIAPRMYISVSSAISIKRRV